MTSYITKSIPILAITAIIVSTFVLSPCSQHTSSVELESEPVKAEEKEMDSASVDEYDSDEKRLYSLDEITQLSDRGDCFYFAQEEEMYYPLDTICCEDINAYDPLKDEGEVSVLTPYLLDSSSSKGKQYYQTTEEANVDLPQISHDSLMLTTNTSENVIAYRLEDSLYRSSKSSAWYHSIDEVNGVAVDGNEDKFIQAVSQNNIRYLTYVCVSPVKTNMELGHYEQTKFIEETVNIDIPCWLSSEIYHGAYGAFYPSFSKGETLEVQKTKDGYFTISLKALLPGSYAIYFTSSSGGHIFAINVL